MNIFTGIIHVSLAVLLISGCKTVPETLPAQNAVVPSSSVVPAPLDMDKTALEVETHYAKALPEVQEYILWTARTFGPLGLWLNEDAFAGLSEKEREKKILYIAKLLDDSEYGRHLCRALSEAGSLKDARLVPGLMKVAAYHLDERDYDCRPKWMAVAALARQESDDAVPLLVGLLDHGNHNVRIWARAALSRKTGQDLKADKQAWDKWWREQGHEALDEKFLRPWKAPAKK